LVATTHNTARRVDADTGERIAKMLQILTVSQQPDLRPQQQTDMTNMQPIKPKLAIISTYDELCGIAGYTKALVPQLQERFDVTVFDLDQFLFRHESRKVQRIADGEIRRMCRELRKFDSVNIQLEHGTLGRQDKRIMKRLFMLIHAAPKVCVTFHTVFASDGFGFLDFLSMSYESSVKKAWKFWKSNQQAQLLGHGLYSRLARAQKSKPLSVIVHTRRDARMLKVIYGLEHVYDHPLAFYDANFRDTTAAVTSRDDFETLRGLSDHDVVLGCFGFVGRYKGIDTAIKALRLLPPNFHLAIFGGIHPNEIKKNAVIDPFVAELLDLIKSDKTWLHDGESVAKPLQDAAKQAAVAPAPSSAPGLQLRLGGEELRSLATESPPDNLKGRVHFMGALPDAAFAKAMAVCDTVLLPYLEVGQSSSGPMSMAVDMGKHIIAARTKTFMQFVKYHPDRFSMFEIGNHVELSQLIAAECRTHSSTPRRYPDPAFNTHSNASTYERALFATSVSA
jgi:glycosyltransferase involved in cell wall biosynthesis